MRCSHLALLFNLLHVIELMKTRECRKATSNFSFHFNAYVNMYVIAYELLITVIYHCDTFATINSANVVGKIFSSIKCICKHNLSTDTAVIHCGPGEYMLYNKGHNANAMPTSIVQSCMFI